MGRILGLLGMVAVGFASVLVGPVSPACACSCVAMSEAEHERNADVVFDGDAVSEEPARHAGADAAQIQITFRVDKVSKGELAGTANVVTHRDGATCGAELKMGHRYRIFARGEGNVLTTSLCSGNRDLGGARSTGTGPTDAGPAGAAPSGGTGSTEAAPPSGGAGRTEVAPPSDEPTDYRPVAAVGGGFVVAAAGLIWFVRRRRNVAG